MKRRIFPVHSFSFSFSFSVIVQNVCSIIRLPNPVELGCVVCGTVIQGPGLGTKKTSRATGLAPRRAEPWATATYNHQGAAVVRNSGDIWSWLWILAVFYKLRHWLKSVKWTQTLMAATLRLFALDSVSMKNQSRKQPSHCWCVPATLRVFVRRKGRDVCVILYSALSPEQLYSPVSFNSSNSIIGPT